MRAVYIQQSHVTHFARHPSHDSPLTSHVTRQRYASHDTRHTSHVSRLNSNVFRISSTSTTVKIHYATQHREHSAITSLTSHTAHDSRPPSHHSRLTSHINVKRDTSHVTRRTSPSHIHRLQHQQHEQNSSNQSQYVAVVLSDLGSTTCSATHATLASAGRAAARIVAAVVKDREVISMVTSLRSSSVTAECVFFMIHAHHAA